MVKLVSYLVLIFFNNLTGILILPLYETAPEKITKTGSIEKFNPNENYSFLLGEEGLDSESEENPFYSYLGLSPIRLRIISQVVLNTNYNSYRISFTDKLNLSPLLLDIPPPCSSYQAGTKQIG